MGGERLPEGTRVAIIFIGVVAGIGTLATAALALLAALEGDTERPGLAILLTLAPFVFDPRRDRTRRMAAGAARSSEPRSQAATAQWPRTGHPSHRVSSRLHRGQCGQCPARHRWRGVVPRGHRGRARRVRAGHHVGQKIRPSGALVPSPRATLIERGARTSAARGCAPHGRPMVILHHTELPQGRKPHPVATSSWRSSGHASAPSRSRTASAVT